MADKLPHVLVDSREPDWVLRGINNKDKILAKKKSLPVGDVAIGGGCAVERKEINNMISDLTDNSSDRPWSQLRELKDNFEERHVICHGVVDDIKSWKKKSVDREADRLNKMKMVLGAGMSIELDWDVKFWKVDNRLDFFTIIENLFKREIGTKRSSKPYKAVKSSASMDERISAILCQVPNVGPSRASKLVNNHKNLKEIINLSKDELQDEMGKKTGKNLYEVFNEDIV